MKPKDEIAIGPEVAPGVRLALRRRNGEVKEVLVREAEEGKSLQPGTELATVGDSSCECDGGHWRELETIYRHGEQRLTEDGPAQVATPEYRKGHDRIFGKKQKVGLA